RHFLLGAKHALRSHDAFWPAGRAGCEKTLATVSGVTRECASSTAAEGEASANSWNEVERSDAGGVTVTSSVHESRTSESGSSKAAPSAANTREGSNRCQRYLSVVSS